MFFVILLIFIFFVVSFLLKGFILVNQTEAIIVEYLGKYKMTLTAGLHFILPGLDKPKAIKQQVREKKGNNKVVTKVVQMAKIPLSEQVYEFQLNNEQTNDCTNVDLSLLLYFQILDPRRVAYSVNDFAYALEELITTKAKQKIIQYNYNDLFNYREKIDEEIRNEIKREEEYWGLKIQRVMIDDIKLSNRTNWQ